ncbi:hypothetical protein MKA43_17680 [[Clostridium] innocuum]|nr:hypothetical protein [[Clostridium] innocuum]
MELHKNNIEFETKQVGNKWLLISEERVLEECETEKECVSRAGMYERIRIPFSVFD